MSHRALTLKYRPQVFADVIGQDHVNLVLGRALESGRVAQGYLFAGARGVGKTTTARILAKALNCETRAAKKGKAGPDPCNTCTSCKEITAGVSLDVAEIDGASNRGIADVQALREKVRFAPTGGKYRVVIIDEVHQLSNDAFAALLKTLEEPPPHLVFIFATTDPQKLPETIRSRTQRFDFARVPLRKVADRLLDIAKAEKKDPEGVKFKLDEGAALLLAHKSEGSMRDAVSALDQVVSSGESNVDETLVRRVLGLADREAFFSILEGVLGRDPKKALHALHAAFARGLDAKDLVEGLSEHVRHILILKVDPDGKELVAATGEDLERLRALGESWSEADLLRLLRVASDASWPMRDSAQPLIHLEAAVLQMATLEPGESLAELLQRLQELESKLGGGGGGGGSASGGSRSTGPRSGTASRSSRSTAPQPAGTRASNGHAAPPVQTQAPRYAPPTASASPAPTQPRASAPAATVTAPRPAEVGTEVALDPQVEARWKSTIQGVNARKRMLGAFLEESALLGVAGDAVVLSMDELHRAVVEESSNQSMIAEELQRVFGRPLGIRCTAVVEQDPRAVPTEADVKPMIDRAIAWFEGDVIERPGQGAERTGA